MLTWFGGRRISRTWQLGDEVVLSRLDSDDETVRVWSAGRSLRGCDRAFRRGRRGDRRTSGLAVRIPGRSPYPAGHRAAREPGHRRCARREADHQKSPMVWGPWSLWTPARRQRPPARPDRVRSGSADRADVIVQRTYDGGAEPWPSASGTGSSELPASVRRTLPLIGPLPVELLDGVTACGRPPRRRSTKRPPGPGGNGCSTVGHLGPGISRSVVRAARHPAAADSQGDPHRRTGATDASVRLHGYWDAAESRWPTSLYSRGLSVWTGPHGMSELMTALGRRRTWVVRCTSD